ncbi:MAG TPA: altronate dehydratase family protein [Verrucomicrobiae bacterium]
MPQRDLLSVALVLNPADNVAVLKKPAQTGDLLTSPSRTVPIAQDIPAGHKIALTEISEGASVCKYGQLIGVAAAAISPGEHVHTHNLSLGSIPHDCQVSTDSPEVNFYPRDSMRFFQGYARSGGRVGTRNYLAVISTVNCSASVSRHVCGHFRPEDLARDFPNIDGIVAFTHKTGCAMDPGEPQLILQRVLAGIARHPNIAGYVMIGLGCEVNQVNAIRRTFQIDQTRPGEVAPVFMNIQSAGGVSKSIEAAVSTVTRMLPAANDVRRSPQPLSKLLLAENCGGSDAHSGITANPALGIASDELVRYGGTSVLAETPEIYGAEHLLTRRAASPQVARKLLSLVRWWEDHTRQHGSSIDNNPSPGNKVGGLTNIFEKSLGAVAKAGQSPLMAVYNYAEPITSPGLCFMDTPGFDPVSMTGLVAGGCNIAIFTTGRGSVYGCKPTPCIKVSSNTALYDSMPDDIDLNAGTILDGTETLDLTGRRLFELIIAVASGQKTKSELSGFGDEEFAPWQLGPTF